MNRDQLSSFGKVIAHPDDPEDWRDYLELHAEATETALARLGEGHPAHLLVVGPSGVGKSSFLWNLFQEMTSRGWTTLETSTGLIVAGMKYIGEWQGNLRKLMDRVTRPRKVILYFSDFHNLTSAGVSEGSAENFSSFLKPWMERGDITLAGEVTPELLATQLRRFPDLLNLVLELPLPEPPRERIPEVVTHVREHLEQELGRGIRLSETVLEHMVEMSELYLPGRAFPGKTLDLLGRVVREKAREQREGPLVLEPDDVVGALSVSTGLPRWLLDDRTPLKLPQVREFFDSRIIGQPEGVRSMVDLITLIKAGLTDPGKPLGVLFFVGPTGVGKTETAKALAEFIFGSPDRLLRIDMSEFKDYESYQRLIGLPYGQGELAEGILTRRVRQNPFSVVLLDEFEKGHPNVYDLMLQVFDDGRLSSARGEVVSFRQCVVIMTSNLGSGIDSSGSLGILSRPHEGPSARRVQKAVEEYFRPEFLNRIQIVHFHPLDLDSMRHIARREVEEVLRRSGIRRRELTVDVEEEFYSLLLREGFHPHFGARPLKRALEQLLLLPLGRKLVAAPARKGLVQVQCRQDKVHLHVLPPEEPPEPRAPRVKLQGRAWTAQEVGQVLERLASILEATGSLVRASAAEKDELVRRSGAEDLWEQPELARRSLARLRHLEQALELQGHWEQGREQAEKRYRQQARQLQPAGLGELAEVVAELEREVELWHRRLTSGEPLFSREAWVVIRALDSAGDRTLVETLILGWAARHRLEATRVHQEPLTYHVSGPFAYGVLGSEHGLHRMVRKIEGERQASTVRVDVWPAASEEERPSPSEVRLEARKRKGGSWAQALHVPSVTVAELSNSLPLEENRALAEELLAARLARPAPESRLIRIYYLDPEREVRDLASGVRSRHLEAVLGGDLREFRAPC